MTWITCRNLKKSYGDKSVLRSVNMDIASGERIGLVGVNGAGKSTLANLIHGSLEADEGTVERIRSGMKIGYLRQSTSYTVRTFADFIGGIAEDETRVLALTSRLGLQKVGEWNADRLEGLSGGERTKLAIAHIWAASPDLLILDEPTNHLDFQGVDWLVQELRSSGGAVLIISHDRYFLDRTVDRIVELDDGVSVDYAGNYTFYREEKARRFRSQLHQYEEQVKNERKIESEISRLKTWSDKAHRDSTKREGFKEFHRKKAKKMDRQIKSRIKRLEKIRSGGLKRPKEEAEVRFELEADGKRGRRIVEASGIGKGFGERLLFRDSSFYIQRGERVGLLGPNGCGKTTLIRLIAGRERPDSGKLWVSPTAKLAYLTQDVTDLDPERTVLALIGESYAFREEAGKVRTLLANMGIGDALLHKPVKQLSLGERTRVKLADLIMREQDLLMLDEPTNHLDLASREQLEETLSSYNGTLLVVSHDRYFLEKTCDKLLVFADSGIRRIESGFSEFMASAAENARTPSRKNLRRPEDRAEGQTERERNKERMQAENLRKEELMQAENLRDEELMRLEPLMNEELMRVENRLAVVLAEIGALVPGSPEYEALDREFKDLVQRKRELG